MKRWHLLLIAALCFLGTIEQAACIGDSPVLETDGADGADGATADPDHPAGGDASGDARMMGPPPCGAPNTACCPGNACSGGAACNGTICACPMGRTPCGAACVDTTNDAANCGRCGHDCLAGMCTANVCSAYTVTNSQAGVTRMFTSGGRLYWSSRNFAAIPGGLFSAKLDGTDVITIHTPGSFTDATGNHPNDACFASATTAGGKAYFLTQNGQIASVLKPGTFDPVLDLRQCTLPCGAGSSTVLKAGIVNGAAVVADPATGKVYFAVSTPYSAPVSGGVFEAATGNRIGAADQANTVDIVLANGSIYWLNAGTYDASGNDAFFNGGVKRASLASPTVEVAIAGAASKYQDMNRLAVDAFSVYFGTQFREVAVASAGATGANPVVFVKGAGLEVASDGTNVYFQDQLGSAVRYCVRAVGCGASGAGVHTLSTNEGGGALTVDETSVLWVNNDGAIRRIAKP